MSYDLRHIIKVCTACCRQTDTLETIVTGINICVLDQSHIMGGDAEQSLDSLCLCPAQLIRVVLCSSWPITPHCYAGLCPNKQR